MSKVFSRPQGLQEQSSQSAGHPQQLQLHRKCVGEGVRMASSYCEGSRKMLNPQLLHPTPQPLPKSQHHDLKGKPRPSAQETGLNPATRSA